MYNVPESILNVNNGKIERVRDYALENMPKLPYHNFNHAEEFVSAVRELTYHERCTYYEAFCLITAGYLHDIVYVVGAKDNEEKSAERSRIILPKFGYSLDEVELISNGLIMATKLPSHPDTLLERIACDADLRNLSTEKFLENNDAIRRELRCDNLLAWQEGTLKFMANHEYYTPSAKRLWTGGKMQNLAVLVNVIEATYDSAVDKSIELGRDNVEEF